MSLRLKALSIEALLVGARETACTKTEYRNRYAQSWETNLLPGLPGADIFQDLSCGAGNELEGKFCAAHSSSALAVNTFGPWRNNPDSLRIGNWTDFESLCFEAKCPTGLLGTPPHLDVLAEGPMPVAIESKCTEWFTRKIPSFAESYDSLRSALGENPWFYQVRQLRADPRRYEHLDAAQLVKHAFGLLKRYGDRPVQLLYLFWEPKNVLDWPECGKHRSEALDLADRVHGSTVELKVMSYGELWDAWAIAGAPAHLARLRTRYDRAISTR